MSEVAHNQEQKISSEEFSVAIESLGSLITNGLCPGAHFTAEPGMAFIVTPKAGHTIPSEAFGAWPFDDQDQLRIVSPTLDLSHKKVQTVPRITFVYTSTRGKEDKDQGYSKGMITMGLPLDELSISYEHLLANVDAEIKM